MGTPAPAPGPAPTGALPAGSASAPAPPAARDARRLALEYALAVGAVVAATLASWGVHEVFTQLDQALLFLLTVLLVSSRVTRGPALVCAVAAVASFDYYFVEPFFALRLDDTKFVVTFVVTLVLGLMVSGMTVRIRAQAEAARDRESRTAALYAMARDLLGETEVLRLANTAARHIRDILGAESVVLLGTPSAWRFPAGPEGPRSLAGPAEEEAARCAFEAGHPAGRGTGVVPEARGLYVPLAGSGGPMGVVGVSMDGAGDPIPGSHRRLVETLAAQTALALERARLAEESATARVAVETERTRSSLLRTVSHDIRTPLASIQGAADVLLEPDSRLDDPGRREMLETVRDEAGRLTRLVNDLLELTRLESETFRLRKEWCPLEEVVGSSLGRVDDALRGRDVTVDLPGDLLLVPVDEVLLQQVFVNLLENAAKYSPEGSPVEIRARTAAGGLVVEVLDRGPGIPPGEEKRVFEPFYRAVAGNGVKGTGLGLTVCQAVLRIHGGTIEAGNREGGGAAVRFVLPLEGEAPPVEVER